METKHTQGEWVVKSNSELCWVESKTHHIATVSFSNESNAKLIAAAPDLLEALIECASILGKTTDDIDKQLGVDTFYAYRMALDAIQKATT